MRLFLSVTTIKERVDAKDIMTQLFNHHSDNLTYCAEMDNRLVKELIDYQHQIQQLIDTISAYNLYVRFVDNNIDSTPAFSLVIPVSQDEVFKWKYQYNIRTRKATVKTELHLSTNVFHTQSKDANKLIINIGENLQEFINRLKFYLENDSYSLSVKTHVQPELEMTRNNQHPYEMKITLIDTGYITVSILTMDSRTLITIGRQRYA